MDQFFVGHAGEAFERLLPITMKVTEETLNGPMQIPKMAEYIGSEAQKAEFKEMLKSAPGYLKQVVDIGRLFSS